MKIYCLEVSGDFACFTRPEMKVERVSYDVMTPSAARAVFESILWKPAIRWQVTKIEVLNPIKWINLRRNEIGKVMSERVPYIQVDDENVRQQRAGLFLRDVRYRLHAYFELRNPNFHKSNFPHLIKRQINSVQEDSENETNMAVKFMTMFERRAVKGQCVNQPYLGCREFAADFKLVDSNVPQPATISESRDLGYMLYDMDYTTAADPIPFFFPARLENGVVRVPLRDSQEVRQ